MASNLPPGISPADVSGPHHHPECDAPRCPHCASRETAPGRYPYLIMCERCHHIGALDEFAPTTCICAVVLAAEAIAQAERDAEWASERGGLR